MPVYVSPFFSTLIIVFAVTVLNAQNNFAFQHLTVEDGLLSNPKVNVYCDSQGYYWFSSVSGLQRFDGKNFLSFKYNYSDKSISGDLSGNPFEDREKNIWVVNQNGVNIFQRQKQTLSRLYMPDAKDSNENNVASIVQDAQKHIWIFTDKNIFFYDEAKKKIKFVETIEKNNGGIIAAVFDKINNGFWINVFDNSNRVFYFDCRKKSLRETVKNFSSCGQIFKNPLSLFAEDADGNLWLATYLGDLSRYDIRKNSFINYNVLKQRVKQKILSPNSCVQSCFDDNRGFVWFGTDYYSGILQYNKKTGRFSEMLNENGSAYGLHYDKNIYGFYEDDEKNIWINTDLGMNIFNESLQQFKYVDQRNNPTGSSFISDITSFFQSSSNDLWITTWGDGVFQYDSNFVLKKNYVHDKKDSNSLGEEFNRTWNVVEDDKKNLIIGCQHGMISILNQKTQKYKNENVAVLSNSTIMHTSEDNKGNIWLALFNGTIAERNKKTGAVIICSGNKNLSPIDGLCTDNKNNLWIGASSGLYCYNEKDKLRLINSFRGCHVLSINLVDDSLLIGGTMGRGLFIYNLHSKSVHFFNTLNNLSSNIIFGGISGNADEIWIVAENAIQKMNLKTGNIFSYDINYGIKDHVFERAICKLKNGTVLVSSNSGIIYFNSNNISNQSVPRNVLITALLIDQQPVSADSMLQSGKIKLNHDQNELTIEYASVSFIGRNTDQYFYKLDEVDKKWIAAGLRRSVTYANLSPGHYTFNVQCRNKDGFPAKQITSFSFTISPPWWQTWWACTVWLLLFFLIIYYAYHYRKRSAAVLSEVRQKIAYDLHDDIGSTLNSISVYSEVALQQIKTNTENAKNILGKMGNASRNMIDNMNDIVWAVNPKNDHFENILLRMQYFAGELLSGKNILISFIADEKAGNIKLPMEKRKNFYLIFKEAITNAYKYSDASSVEVIIKIDGKHLCMTIKDNGNGFEIPLKNNGGNGLKSMQIRAAEISARLKIDTMHAKGTEVRLEFFV